MVVVVVMIVASARLLLAAAAAAAAAAATASLGRLLDDGVRAAPQRAHQQEAGAAPPGL